VAHESLDETSKQCVEFALGGGVEGAEGEPFAVALIDAIQDQAVEVNKVN